MTRIRALVISGVLALGIGFGGCFPDSGDDVCAAPAATGQAC